MRFLALATTVATTAALVTAPAYAADKGIDDVFLGIGTTNTSANISWTSTTPATDQVVEVKDGETVAAKTDTTAFNGMYGVDAELTGLTPGKAYSYRVGSDTAGWSDWYTFTPEAESTNWNFLFYGDPQIGASKRKKDDPALWKHTVDTTVKNNPGTDFLLTAGDQVNADRSATEEQKEAEYDAFFAPAAMRQLRTAVQDGNHDKRSLDAFHTHYNLPNAEDQNYYFTYNNALIISLDTNIEDTALHTEFIKKAIAAHPNSDWVIATFHQPPYAQSYHAYEDKTTWLRDELTPVLSESGVDLVLSGHEHIYGRSHLMKGNTPVKQDKQAAPGDTFTPADGEVLYITANSATGSKFYDFSTAIDEQHPNLTFEDSVAKNMLGHGTAYWNQDYTPDYTDVQVTPTSLKVITRNVDDNSVVDEVTLNKASTGLSDAELAAAIVVPLLAVLGGLGALIAQFIEPIRAQLRAWGLPV